VPLGPQLRQAAQQVEVRGVTLGRQRELSRNSLWSWQRLTDQRRASWLELYERVMALHAQGGTMKGIGQELSIDHRTVRNFITAGAFPERAPRARGPTPLDPYLSDIEERIAQGCRFPELIWREVKQRGYTGSRAAVRNCVIRLLFPQGKKPLFQASVRTMPCPSARRVFGWLIGWRKLAVAEEPAPAKVWIPRPSTDSAKPVAPLNRSPRARKPADLNMAVRIVTDRERAIVRILRPLGIPRRQNCCRVT